MFKIGEYVVHGRNGVCKIDDITKLEISGADKDKLYYVLVPMKSEQSKVFYPVDNNRVTMRSVISKDQAEDIVNEIKSIEPLWINNERLREAKYKEAISSCDCVEWIRIINNSDIIFVSPCGASIGIYKDYRYLHMLTTDI